MSSSLKPYGWSSFKEEIPKLWKLAWPIALSGVLYMLPNQVHLAVLGHYQQHSHENLAALSLAGSFMGMTITTFASGFASVIATIGGQAFGKKQHKVIGLVLQRTMLLLSLAYIPISILYWYSENFFLLLKQDPEVARLAARYSRYNIIALWPGLNFHAILIFLQCQGIVLIDLYVNIFVNVINVGLSYFVIAYWGLGLDGVIIADIVNAWLFFLAILFLTWWNGIFSRTLPRISLEIFRNWSKIFAIAIPGALMICTETWLFEILQFAAGVYGSLPQTVYGLSFQMIMIPLMIIGGFIVAVTTRVSNSLGEKNPDAARHASITAFIVCIASGIVYGIIILAIQKYIGSIFTSDPHVVEGLHKICPLIVGIMMFSVVQNIIAGVLHGSGRQLLGSLANIIGFDIIALPCALLLAKYWIGGDNAAFSLWTGVLVGICGVDVVLIIIYARLNWIQEVEDAQFRVESQTEGEDFLKEEKLEEGVLPQPNGSHSKSDTPNNTTPNNTTPNTTGETSDTTPLLGSHSAT
jgi:MATE family multidrug resistance protein